MHVYGRLSSAREKFIFGCRSAELTITRWVLRHSACFRSVTRLVISFVDPFLCFLVGECKLSGWPRPDDRLHSPRGSNWDPGERLTLLGLVRETLGITDRPLTAPTLATVAICLCAAQCCCCIGCGRHSDRVYVAMVAQDLVRFKTAQYFTTRNTIRAW